MSARSATTPAGYAQLVALLVERSGGPSGAAIAADSDDHTVTSLLSAAGRPLAIADDDSVDDFAERFADDDSLEEMQSPPAERRAVGLARALQAGALSAVTLPAPRDLAGYKQVLAAHAALASGRHSAAVALREVLRELYPAALRAYPDPAEPVALAVLDALPEPGMLGGTVAAVVTARSPRTRSPRTWPPTGVADADRDQRGGHRAAGRHLARPRAAAASTGRSPPPSPRPSGRPSPPCGPATPAARRWSARSAPGSAPPRPAAGRRAAARRGEPVGELTGLRQRPAAPGTGLRVRADRRPTGRPQPTPDAASGAADAAGPAPTAGRRRRRRPPRPLGPPPVAPAPVTAAAGRTRPGLAAGRRAAGAAGVRAAPARRAAAPTAGSRPDQPAGLRAAAPAARDHPDRAGAARHGAAGRGRRAVPADADHRRDQQRPGRAAAHGHPAPPEDQRQRSAPAAPDGATGGFSATDLSIPVPPPRPGPEAAPAGLPRQLAAGQQPGGPGRQLADQPGAAYSYGGGRGIEAPTDPAGRRRVTPPWLADDLPQEPPMLRLVEPPPLADRALRDGLTRRRPASGDAAAATGRPGARPPATPAGAARRAGRRADRAAERRPPPPVEHRPPPVSDEGDGDLLIFAQARSAWFVGHADECRPGLVDHRRHRLAGRRAGGPPGGRRGDQRPGCRSGCRRPTWSRARRCARSVHCGSSATRPASPRTPPATSAAGVVARRSAGSRSAAGPGREAAGGWDFSRDHGDRDDDREYEYRSAGYQS